MKLFYKSGIRCWVSVLLLVLISISCQKDDESVEQFLDSLPHEHPGEINRFQQADSIYFDHLGYTSIPRKDGSVVLYDRGIRMLFQVSGQGNLRKILSQQGRGPGEVLDIISLARSIDGGFLLYDQKNRKGVVFDNSLRYKSEFSPEPFEENNTSAIFPAASEDEYLILHSSYDYLRDKSKQPRSFLTLYNIEDGTHNKFIAMQDRQYARLIMDGEVSGATAVIYSSRQLIVNNHQDETIYSFWTGSGEIAELSADFDTLRTIPVNLPSQSLSSEVRDSLKERYRSEQWRTLQEKLPDVKVPVEEMKLDEQNRFWLKLNYRGDTAKWLIMNQEGEPQKIVHLPKESMLTHVSENHLGLRLDDITFALYEPVD